MANLPPSGRIQRGWSIDAYVRTKQSMESVLNERFGTKKPSDRLKWMRAQILELDDKPSDAHQIRRFVLTVLVLEHHAVFGGMLPHHVKQIEELGKAILLTNGIEQHGTTLSVLHMELQRTSSLVAARSGRLRLAAWSFENALFVGRRNAEQMTCQQHLQLGAMLARLGHVGSAKSSYGKALEIAQNQQESARAYLALAQLARVEGNVDDSRSLLASMRGACADDQELTRRAEWESLWIAAVAERDAKVLMRPSNSAMRPHFKPYEVLEARLFAYAIGATRELQKASPLTALARRSELGLARTGPLLRIARVIEDCEDGDIEFAVRVKALQDALEDLDCLQRIDYEMLALGAMARWLSRSHAFELASFALAECKNLALKVSGGRALDPLNLVSDIYGRDWFLERGAESLKKSS